MEKLGAVGRSKYLNPKIRIKFEPPWVVPARGPAEALDWQRQCWYKTEVIVRTPTAQTDLVRKHMHPEHKILFLGKITGWMLMASAGAAWAQNTPPMVDANNTLSADRPILSCPVTQPEAKNGSRPNAELLKKIVQCRKGEKAAAKGFDGAITIDVTELKIGAPRPWRYNQDSGSGQAGTQVFPVKVTYTEKTFYRTRTVVGEDWMRVMNFYVNSFGEWQSGSEEHIKSPESKIIQR